MRFSRDDLRQIEYAGILHDFGKVGVRERVLVKPKKLYEEDLRGIQFRFAYIRKTLEADAAERKLRMVGMPVGSAHLDSALRSELDVRFREIDDETARRVAELDDLLMFIVKANEPALLEQGGLERLLELGQFKYIAPSGEPRPYLEPDELGALQVKRGSLTDVERVEIESHVVHTFKFLQKIPWGRSLRKVPADRRCPPRISERRRVSARSVGRRNPHRVAHDDHRRHLRRAHGVGSAVQARGPHRAGA